MIKHIYWKCKECKCLYEKLPQLRYEISRELYNVNDCQRIIDKWDDCIAICGGELEEIYDCLKSEEALKKLDNKK